MTEHHEQEHQYQVVVSEESKLMQKDNQNNHSFKQR